ncbi:MAG: prepilin-type N-terminal cleavage/methylation domain-containing protein [Candidatus Angelobacter sp.]
MRENDKARSRGFSLIEVTLAMSILAVGLLGGIVVIGVATANNGRSKQHTTAATLAESTMEKIVAIPSSATGAATQTQITDCAGNAFTIETSPGGSPLINSGAFAGSIDFSQAPAPNYSMAYLMCSSGTGVTYDVRWRVDAGPTPGTQLVTVSAKTAGGSGTSIFTLPYTLHQLRGDF